MKDSFWFQHDSNAQHDERVLELRAEYGWEGYGLFWGLVEKMRDSPEYRMSMATVGGLSAGMGVLKPVLVGIIELACKYGLLATEENGAYFYSPSLRRRMGQWDNKKASLSEAGRVGAERKKALKEAAKLREVEATLKPPLSHPGTSASTVDKRREEKSTSYDVAPPPEALKATAAKQAAALLTDPDDLQHWSEGPLTKPKPFHVICERLGFLEIDFEHYRKQALVSAEDANVSRTISQWSGWIRNYLNNQMKNGPLLKIQAGGGTLPTHATPDSQYPPLGQEQAGQVFYITGVHDQSHDRMYATSRLNKWPTATIVSLTHPAGAYTMQDGQVIRK